MSNFKTKARHRTSGEVHDVWCFDDHFGKHQYGYAPNAPGNGMLTEQQFYEQYEELA